MNLAFEKMRSDGVDVEGMSADTSVFFLSVLVVGLSSSRSDKRRLFIFVNMGSVADRDAFSSCESSSVSVIIGFSTDTMSSAVRH